MQLIPLRPSIASNRFTVTLAGADFAMRVYWNDRVAEIHQADWRASSDLAAVARYGDKPRAGWFMDILDIHEQPIVHGVRLVLRSPLGRESVDPRYPSGIFALVDTSGDQIEASFDDMGTRVQLWFLSLTELRAWGGAAWEAAFGAP